MNKLAHSHDPTMDAIDEARAIENGDDDVGLPTALTLIKAIALGGNFMKGHPEYLTKMQMVTLARNWLKAKGYRMKGIEP